MKNIINSKIVIHQTWQIIDLIKFIPDNCLLFFDDCLYSQYMFIKSHIDELKRKNVLCILGLSPKLLRKEDNVGLYEIESYKIHNDVNQHIFLKEDEYYSDLMNGFMTLTEIQELIQNSNIKLACHGCCHLNLRKMNISQLEKSKLFSLDVKSAVQMMIDFNLLTDIFVYPYEFKPIIGDKILRNCGFKYIFGGENDRIYIEDLLNKSKNTF